jgi:pimeloyl-ACP methyl ester carboxylesterase
MKVLIAGVGHPNLKDLSFGQVLLPHLKKQKWTENFDLENLSFGAIAVLQWFQDFPDKYERVVFVSAAELEHRRRAENSPESVYRIYGNESENASSEVSKTGNEYRVENSNRLEHFRAQQSAGLRRGFYGISRNERLAQRSRPFEKRRNKGQHRI